MIFRLNNLHPLQTKIYSTTFLRSFRQFQPKQDASKKTDLKIEEINQIGDQNDNKLPFASKIIAYFFNFNFSNCEIVL